MYSSKLYTRSKRRNNFTVVYQSCRAILYGVIEYFVCISVSGTYFAYACINQLVPENSCKDHFNITHTALDNGVSIVPVHFIEPKVLVNVDNILCKCVFITVHSNNYICIPPNTLLLD